MIETLGALFTNAAPWISLGLNLLSTVEQFDAAKEIEDEADFNRRVFEDEAAAVWNAYEDRASILLHEQHLFTGAGIAAYGKSGVEVAGSPILVLNDMVYRQALDLQALMNEGDAERRKVLNKGYVAEWQAYQEASSVRRQALGNLGSTLLSQNIHYPSPWKREDTRAVARSGESGYKPPAAVTLPEALSPQSFASSPRFNLPMDRGNQVPGGRGWRPLSAR